MTDFLPQPIKDYVRSTFPIDQYETVLGILSAYQSPDSDRRSRVLLIALEQAGQNLGRLKAYVDLAQEDDRELLDWAKDSRG
ncbi:MAG: hypothetical protein EA001_16470 [Oscillatoriales cyanobacterium]|nr:MAG: hypothetical protein EA001_16470 [Oscillatoriales cyanobacterium]